MRDFTFRAEIEVHDLRHGRWDLNRGRESASRNKVTRQICDQTPYQSYFFYCSSKASSFIVVSTTDTRRASMITFFETRSAICGFSWGGKTLKVFVSGLVFPPQKIFGNGRGWYVGWIHWVEIYVVPTSTGIHPSEGIKIACLPIEYW